MPVGLDRRMIAVNLLNLITSLKFIGRRADERDDVFKPVVPDALPLLERYTEGSDALRHIKVAVSRSPDACAPSRLR